MAAHQVGDGCEESAESACDDCDGDSHEGVGRAVDNVDVNSG